MKNSDSEHGHDLIVVRDEDGKERERIVGRIRRDRSHELVDALRKLNISGNPEVSGKIREWCEECDIFDGTAMLSIVDVFFRSFIDEDEIGRFLSDARRNRIPIRPGSRISHREEFGSRFSGYFRPEAVDMLTGITADNPKIGKFELFISLFLEGFKKCRNTRSGDVTYRGRYVSDVKSGRSNLAGMSPRRSLNDAYSSLTRLGVSLVGHRDHPGRIGTLSKTQGMNIYGQLMDMRRNRRFIREALRSFLIYGSLDMSQPVDAFSGISSFEEFQDLLVAMQLMDYSASENIHHILMCNEDSIWMSRNLHGRGFRDVMRDCRSSISTEWGWCFQDQSKSLRVSLRK